MNKYYLRDEGYSFKKIYHGKKWVGRVCQHADGHFMGIIGKTTFHAPTMVEAFDNVVALQLGFDNVAALHDHNRKISAHNRAQKSRARYLADRFLYGSHQERMAVLDEVFNPKKH